MFKRFETFKKIKRKLKVCETFKKIKRLKVCKIKTIKPRLI